MTNDQIDKITSEIDSRFRQEEHVSMLRAVFRAGTEQAIAGPVHKAAEDEAFRQWVAGRCEHNSVAFYARLDGWLARAALAAGSLHTASPGGEEIPSLSSDRDASAPSSAGPSK